MYNNNYENLKNEVMEILESMAVDSNLETVVEEVIYYYQTEAFFNRHKNAINELAHELSEDIYGNPFEIYHNLNGGCSKNNMAWFGFEEVTRIIASELEIY